MKIKCNRDSLLTAFLTVAPVAPTRSPKPILQNVKIDASADKTTLVATDMEQGICYDVADVEVEVPGAVILPISRFGSLLRESTDKVLHIESGGQEESAEQGTSIEGERSKFTFAAPDPADFPSVHRFDASDYIELSARLFREMIRRTIFAIDPESSRYALGGVLLEPADGKLTAVGTDGRRLARMEGPVQTVGNPKESESSQIVPGRSMQLIERAVSDADAEIQVALSASEIVVTSQRATIYARLLEGRFPSWRDVFPKRQQGIKIDLPVGPFYSAVRQAAIVTSEESRGIDFVFGAGSLVLVGRTADVGQARVDLPIGYDGPSISIMLDPRYVNDVLKVLDPESTIHLDLQDGESAAVVATDDGYGYVIMPLSRDRASTSGN